MSFSIIAYCCPNVLSAVPMSFKLSQCHLSCPWDSNMLMRHWDSNTLMGHWDSNMLMGQWTVIRLKDSGTTICLWDSVTVIRYRTVYYILTCSTLYTFRNKGTDTKKDMK